MSRLSAVIANGLPNQRPIFLKAILVPLEHLEVLREKIARLRSEIAQLQELNERYRRREVQDGQAHFAHGQRQERLLEIQQELTKLARLGGRVRALEQMKEQHRSRPYLINKVS